MTNRRMRNSDYLYDPDADSIGLTSAFPATKGPQSVEYDKGDQAIGLTGAFAPIPEQNEPHAWDEAGKWKDFDWEAYQSEAADDSADEVDESTPETPQEDAPADGAPAATQQAPSTPASTSAPAPAPARSSSGRGRHAAPDASMSPRMQQARKTRRALIVVVILLIIVVGVVTFLMVRTFSSSQEEAAHQAQEHLDAPKEDIGSDASDGAGGVQAKLTDVPDLSSLMGMTVDAAIEKIGHGAMALPAQEVNEEGNPIKSNVNVALNDEPIDSKTGSPMVYLGLDSDGKIIQIGYSASASALGFGSLSFSDAVNNEHVVEKTLAKIGVDVPQGSAVLPTDASEYSTYAADGTTVTRERCAFEGDVDMNGTPCTWSAVLSYDYTTQVLTGDLSDTVRIIYVYITKK